MEFFLNSHPHPLNKIDDKSLHSNMYDVSARWYESLDKPADGTGGGIFSLGNILIVLGPKGNLSWVELNKMQGPYSISAKAPMNVSDLIASGLVEASRMEIAWFRAAGIYAELRDDAIDLFVTHHVFENGCFYLQLSSIDLKFDAKIGFYPASKWHNLFRPDPCIHIGDSITHPFGGNQAGGKIVSLNADELLVSFGDHAIDGFETANDPQDPNSPYGKIWRIAKDGSAHSLYALGVRNPQGLFIDEQKRVWESEHGPQGGDELNLILDKANYGWPFQTYGVFYGGADWPLDRRQGDHSDPRFIPPVFSWIPSIAPTNITSVTSSRFDLWKGDLLLATLKDQSIHRLRIVSDRVVYDERIGVGRRLRDIVSLASGKFALLDDDQTIGILDTPGPNLHELRTPEATVSAEAARPMANSPGAKIFVEHCAACHDLTKNNIGPSLAEIVNRPVGKYPGYTYSADLADSDRTWTKELLLSFLRDPKAIFPATAMNPANVSAAEAEDLYAFLAAPYALPAAPSSGAEADPFLIPLADTQLTNVVAYNEFSPGFWVGFDSDKKTSVDVRQEFTGVVDGKNRYAIKVDVRDLASSEWMTVERKLSTRGDFELTVKLRARLSKPGTVTVELYVPQKNGSGKDLVLGEPDLTTDLQTFEFTRSIKSSDFGDVDEKDEGPRVAVFLPLENQLTAEFAQFDISTK